MVKYKKSAQTPSLEITIETLWNQKAPVVANYPDYKNAVVIVGTMKDGVGEKAGLKKDDLIIALNGEKVNTEHELYGKLRAPKVNDVVELTIYRPSLKKEIMLKVLTRSIESRFKSIF